MKLYSLSCYLELKNKDDLRHMPSVSLLRLSWWTMTPLLNTTTQSLSGLQSIKNSILWTQEAVAVRVLFNILSLKYILEKNTNYIKTSFTWITAKKGAVYFLSYKLESIWLVIEVSDWVKSEKKISQCVEKQWYRLRSTSDKCIHRVNTFSGHPQ